MHHKRVAIIGASPDRARFSNKSIRAHARQGWEVFPVSPHGGRIEGLPAYRAIDDVPAPLDRVSLYVRPQIGLTLLPAIAAKRPAEVFFNPGSASADLISEARRLGLKVVERCSILDVGEIPANFPDA
jgi:uncharacterized protein